MLAGLGRKELGAQEEYNDVRVVEVLIEPLNPVLSRSNHPVVPDPNTAGLSECREVGLELAEEWAVRIRMANEDFDRTQRRALSASAPANLFDCCSPMRLTLA